MIYHCATCGNRAEYRQDATDATPRHFTCAEHATDSAGGVYPADQFEPGYYPADRFAHSAADALIGLGHRYSEDADEERRGLNIYGDCIIVRVADDGRVFGTDDAAEIIGRVKVNR